MTVCLCMIVVAVWLCFGLASASTLVAVMSAGPALFHDFFFDFGPPEFVTWPDLESLAQLPWPALAIGGAITAALALVLQHPRP